MKPVKNSYKVSWPTEANLCQVRLFQSGDCPSEVGLQAPDHPQSKVSNSNIVVSDGCPGSSVSTFKGRNYANPFSEKVVSHIPQIQWRTPPKLDLKYKCCVAAGEESEEVEVQKQRERRELEAVYPHLSAIPPSPSISLDVEDECFDDSHTPVIPLIAIEEAADMDFPSDRTAALNMSVYSQPPKIPQSPSTSKIIDIPQCNLPLSPKPSVAEKSDLTTLQDLGGPVVVAAAAATAIMRSKEPASMIDPELLVKFLSNPKMTEKLINERGLASSTTTGTSGAKAVQPSALVASCKPSFLTKESMVGNFKFANAGKKAIHRPFLVKEPPAAFCKTMVNAATTEIRAASRRKPVGQSVHFLSSTPDSLVQKSTTENIQPANPGQEALPRLVNQPLAANAKIEIGFRPKPLPISGPLPSLSSDVLVDKFFSEHCQTAYAGNVSILTSSVTLLSSTPEFFSRKSTGKHIQLADAGNLAVLRPVKQVIGTKTESGRDFKSEMMTPLVPLLNSTSDFPKKKFKREHSQLAGSGNVLSPRPAKPLLSATFRAGTGFSPKRVAPSVPLSSLMPDLSKKFAGEHGSQLNSTFSEPMTEKQLQSLPRLQDKLMVNQLDIPHEASCFGTSPLFKSPAIPQSVLLEGSHHEVSRLKKLIDVHGSHECAGNKDVAGVKLLAPTPSKPNVEILKKLINEYGSHKNLENPLPGAERTLFPLTTSLSGMVEPLRVNSQSTEVLSKAFCASPFSSTTTLVPLPKDTSYLKSLIKQHGKGRDSRDFEPLQHREPHNYLQIKELDPKYQNPCIFYNSSKGCRNGSSCPYQHEMPKRWGSDGVLEATGAKRMRLGGEHSGRT